MVMTRRSAKKAERPESVGDGDAVEEKKNEYEKTLKKVHLFSSNILV
jgi:hypothetical protein